MKKQMHILKLILFVSTALLGATALYGEVTLVTYTRKPLGVIEYIDKKDAYDGMRLQPGVSKITLATISDDLAGCLRTLFYAIEIEKQWLLEHNLPQNNLEIALPKEVFSRDITQANFTTIFLPLIKKLLVVQKNMQEDMMSAALSAVIMIQCQNISFIQLLQLLQTINYFDVTIANISIAPLIANYVAKYFYENYFKQESIDGLHYAITESYINRNTEQRSLILPENINPYVALDVFSNVNSLVASYILYKITQEKLDLFDVWYCLHTLTGHTGWVTSAAFNPAGTQVVTASEDQTAKIWDVATRQCLHTLDRAHDGHTDVVSSAAFSPAGTQVVTASADGTAKIWNVETGHCLQTFDQAHGGHTAEVGSAAFNHDGTQVVTASFDNTAKIWDVATGQCFHTLTGHTDLVYSAAFNPNGTQVVTGSEDQTAKIWDVATGQCLHTLDRAHGGHTDVVGPTAYNAAGTQVVTASCDGTAKIWDAKNGDCLHTLTGHTGWVTSAAFNPAGTQLVTASCDGTAKIWDVATGKCLHTLDRAHNEHKHEVFSAVFNPAGTQVVTASDDETAKIWQHVILSGANGELWLYQILFVYMLDAMKKSGQTLDLSAQSLENQILLDVLNSFNDDAKKYLIKNYDIKVAQDIVSQQASDVGTSVQHAASK